MEDEFRTLEQTLKAVCGQGPVYYVPNRGNWGDGLIRHGTLKFLHDINLDYKEVTSRGRGWLLPIIRGGTVIYGGGGAWCELWTHSARWVKTIKLRFNVVVLPSTYELEYAIPEPILFCRDTFDSKQNVRDAIFCHDMAFYIGKEFLGKSSGGGNGYFFRTDKESANRLEIPASNLDLSLRGNHLSDVRQFFEEINRFAVVYTDRLHVSIAACLLEKEVHLYPGSYFKNRAVYLSSMKDFFENVNFHENFEFQQLVCTDDPSPTVPVSPRSPEDLPEGPW